MQPSIKKNPGANWPEDRRTATEKALEPYGVYIMRRLREYKSDPGRLKMLDWIDRCQRRNVVIKRSGGIAKLDQEIYNQVKALKEGWEALLEQYDKDHYPDVLEYININTIK